MGRPPQNWDVARRARKVIVHHSATRRLNSDSETIRGIHIVENGWSDVGYHFIIEMGRVRLGRPIWRMGSHDAGENHDSIGICLVGDYREGFDEPGVWAWPQLVTLCADLLDQLDLPTEVLRGHREDEPASTPTACPGFDPNLLRQEVRFERSRRRELVPNLYPYTSRL